MPRAAKGTASKPAGGATAAAASSSRSTATGKRKATEPSLQYDPASVSLKQTQILSGAVLQTLQAINANLYLQSKQLEEQNLLLRRLLEDKGDGIPAVGKIPDPPFFGVSASEGREGAVDGSVKVAQWSWAPLCLKVARLATRFFAYQQEPASQGGQEGAGDGGQEEEAMGDEMMEVQQG